MFSLKNTWIIFLIGILAFGCNSNEEMSYGQIPYILDLPTGFPYPEIPTDNDLTYERIRLGKKLFYDPILSRDSTISCRSCHVPSLAFTDGLAFSIGIEGQQSERNSPSLANVAYLSSFFHDGGVRTLELQPIVPITDHREMDFTMEGVAERMQADSLYVDLSQRAYGRSPDPFVISRALSAFQRTLISGNSRFDQFHFQQDTAVFSTKEKLGYQLFFSETTNCTKCHTGFNLTNGNFANNGLFSTQADSGRMRITNQEIDRDLFRVPSLRNVGLTSPYMHDGQLTTLKEVVEHYNMGGKDQPQKSDLIQPLNLTQEEQDALLAFLQTLTDSVFIYNPAYLP